MKAIEKLIEEIGQDFDLGDEVFKSLIGDKDTDVLGADVTASEQNYEVADFASLVDEQAFNGIVPLSGLIRRYASGSKTNYVSGDFLLDSDSDDYDFTGLVPCSDTNDAIDFFVGALKWSASSVNLSNNVNVYAGQSISGAAGAVKLSVQSGNWENFSTSDGLKRLRLPKDADEDRSGGSVFLWYNKNAWEHAFKDDNSDILITNDGSVYKDSIKQTNLVVSGSGELGFAGLGSRTAINEVILEVGDQQWKSNDAVGIGEWEKYNVTGGIKDYNFTPSNIPMVEVVPINSTGAGVFRVRHKDVQWTAPNSAVGTERSYTSSPASSVPGVVFELSASSSWDTFYDTDSGLLEIALPKTAPDDGLAGTVKFYYDKTAWTYALNGKDGSLDANKVIIADDGSVYIGEITESALIVNGAGEVGKAGKAAVTGSDGGAVKIRVQQSVIWSGFATETNGLKYLNLPDDKYKGLWDASPIPSTTAYQAGAFDEPDDRYNFEGFIPALAVTDVTFTIGDFEWKYVALTGNYAGQANGATAGVVAFTPNGNWNAFNDAVLNGLKTLSIPRLPKYAVVDTETDIAAILTSGTLTGFVPLADQLGKTIVGSNEREAVNGARNNGTYNTIGAITGATDLNVSLGEIWSDFVDGVDQLVSFRTFTKTISFYYQTEAWAMAFKGTNHKVIITRRGAVFKNSISNANLVIDEEGRRGESGWKGAEYESDYFDSPNDSLSFTDFAPVFDSVNSIVQLIVGTLQWKNEDGVSGAANPTRDYVPQTTYPIGGTTEYQQSDFFSETSDDENFTGHAPMNDTGGGLTLVSGDLEYETNTGVGAGKTYTGKVLGSNAGAMRMKPLVNQNWQDFAPAGENGMKTLILPVDQGGVGDMEIGNTFIVR